MQQAQFECVAVVDIHWEDWAIDTREIHHHSTTPLIKSEFQRHIHRHHQIGGYLGPMLKLGFEDHLYNP